MDIVIPVEGSLPARRKVTRRMVYILLLQLLSVSVSCLTVLGMGVVHREMQGGSVPPKFWITLIYVVIVNILVPAFALVGLFRFKKSCVPLFHFIFVSYWFGLLWALTVEPNIKFAFLVLSTKPIPAIIQGLVWGYILYKNWQHTKYMKRVSTLD